MNIIRCRLFLSLVLCHVTGAVGQPALAQADAVSDLRPVRVGPYWVALRWESAAPGHDVLFREAQSGRGKAPLQTRPGIRATEYSVVNLKSGTPYEFRIRAHRPGDGSGLAAESTPLVVTTLPETPRHIAGLALWPPRPVGTFPDDVTEPCIEAFQGKLYVLEAHDNGLTLSRVAPESLRVEWSRDIARGIDEPPLRPRAPDMCVFQDRLWIAWQVDAGEGEGVSGRRVRVMSYDPAAERGENDPVGVAAALSAPVEIEPSSPERGVCCASLSPFMDTLWVSWLETWRDDEGRRRGTLRLAPHEPGRGRAGRPRAWDDCPVALPGRPSISLFGSDLLLLFSDEAAQETTPGREALWCARFDGRRFHNVHLLRTLGSNREARGAQLGDRFYFVYRSDAHYPGSAGLYHDIALGRLLPATASPRLVIDQLLTGLPYVTDMKHNSAPDITVLGDAMFTVHAKRDDARGLLADEAGLARPRGFGTYIGKIARVLERRTDWE